MDRKALAAALPMSIQGLGQAINGQRGKTTGLSFENNLKAAKLLKVDPHWLATGQGPMTPGDTAAARMSEYESGGVTLSESASELGALLDLIPRSKRIARATAYAAASEAILRVLAKLNDDAPRQSQPGVNSAGMQGE